MNDLLKKHLSDASKKFSSSVLFDEPLSGHNTIGIGGPVSAWYVPRSLEELREMFPALSGQGARLIVAGSGSNTLMPDGGLDAVMISLADENFRFSLFSRKSVTVGAGIRLSVLISQCAEKGFSGMEGMVGIPGTVGGAILSNAGYISKISDNLERVVALDKGGALRTFERKDLIFGYRRSPFKKDEIIVEATFRLEESTPEKVKELLRDNFAKKMTSQPLDKKTLGCIFKNPEGAPYKSGEMIDMMGMKGERRGKAVISEKHANFIVNTGGATAEDVKSLIAYIQGRVKQKFKVELEPEIEIL
jgi:UDP-N-acetylmuramate dehydrogenase